MSYADIIIKGNIFDSVGDEPFKGYVATKGNRILEVGKGDDISKLKDESTKVYEMGEKLVIPGIHDSHVHLVLAGLFNIYANLINARSEEEVCKIMRDWADKNPQPKDEWVIGFSWYHVFWDEQVLPTKASLDKYFPDQPVFLLNAEAHGGWTNSKGLEIAGVTKDTPDPFGGAFERDENGEPTGFLYESAIGPVTAHAFNFTPEQMKSYVKSFMKVAASEGITSINDVMPYFHGNIGDVEVYSQMDKDGELTIRIHAAPNLLGDLDKICAHRDALTSDKLKIDMVKQFLDGVSTTHTALMLDDYSDKPGERGISLADLDAIEKAVPEAHKRGISIKLHSCGDASCRLALDYYEKAIKMYGKNACRHNIEHVELISPEDIPRMGELGIIPSMQPEHIALTQVFDENPYPVTMGPERASRTWQFKTMLDTCGVVACGSDCPVVSSNPFLGIFRAVTRLHNDGKPEGGWNPTEKLTMAEVLKGYTSNGAYGVRREHELGTLEKGKFADIAVIDRNLFETVKEDPWKIMDASVVLTVSDGKVVYEK